MIEIHFPLILIILFKLSLSLVVSFFASFFLFCWIDDNIINDVFIIDDKPSIIVFLVFLLFLMLIAWLLGLWRAI